MRDHEWRLNQAQVLLDVFEQEWGRPSRSRNWIGAQNPEHVQFVKRRVLEVLSDDPKV